MLPVDVAAAPLLVALVALVPVPVVSDVVPEVVPVAVLVTWLVAVD